MPEPVGATTIGPDSAADLRRRRTCPACAAPSPEPFFRLPPLPVHGTAVFTTADDARSVALADQELGLCERCGLVFNLVFDPTRLDYTGTHEESQHHSPHFVKYAASLSADWVERHHLAGRHVVEVGCGAGDFAVALLRAGVGRVTGVDPHFLPHKVPSRLTEQLRAVPEFFTPAHAAPGTAALVCRHTLEHVPDLAEFGHALRAADVPLLLVEVPDFGRILDEGSFWDLQYEHCSNFTPATLAAFLRRTGFDVLTVATAYADQYVLAEATPGEPSDAPATRAIVDVLQNRGVAFADRVKQRIEKWADWFDDRRASGEGVAVWGGGAKGLTFLALLESHLGPVQAVVDINPGLQGHFLGGTGLPIVSPAGLVTDPPHTVVVMNPVYSDEIRDTLDSLGLDRTALLAV